MLLPVVIVLAVLAVAAAMTTRSRLVRRTLAAGGIIAVAVWFPLLAAIALDPEGEIVGNALGLGLLAWAGTALGLLVLLVGLVMRLVVRE